MFKPASKKTADRLLLQLADFLEVLPRKRFNYSSWVGADWAGSQDLSCGTTACAFGWAATLPGFRRLGLRLAPDSEVGAGRVVNKNIPDDDVRFNSLHHPSILTAALTLGLRRDEAALLFLPSESGLGGNATPKQVARHIRKFVKERVA